MISKMEHVAVMVTDMERSIKFYSETFRFKVRLRGVRFDREMAFLYLESHPSMEIELIQELKSIGDYSNTGKVNHLAFTVEDIDEAFSYYKEKGIEFLSDEAKQTLEGGRMFFFSGPDGELLQLVERGL
ncbi:VOC family protein [Peribacillus muralis]|uniref:VOC family protein n=1 Tax=Peribacillus muralis TaxID=264697 RepID=UPI001F4F0933|nr:VOC family protein [Peribacillus muralis]MCK1992927.1 VOC family protein [Peribacillus muralis]MCK2013482.1 VOC family protein [Peribacillus muralis]